MRFRLRLLTYYVPGLTFRKQTKVNFKVRAIFSYDFTDLNCSEIEQDNYSKTLLRDIFDNPPMLNIRSEAGAASHFGSNSGSTKMMQLFAAPAPAPQHCFKGIVSRDFAILFLIQLDRYEVPNKAGSGLFLI
jgi:hypothetical protein